ncbi:MAG TPA: 2-dehydropantoate 2-reductase [Herpetosiphonaceae bacterium]
MDQPTIGIYGAGSIGAYVGAHLIKAGLPTILVGRERLGAEIDAHGLRVTSLAGTDFLLAPGQVRYHTTPEALAGCDIVCVTVKSAATPAARELLPILRPGAIVVSLQNGVRNAAALREALPGATVLAGMVPYNVVWNAPAHFHCGTAGALAIERQNPATDQVLAAFRRAGLEAGASDHIEGVLWGKLLLNLNNPINALAGLPLRDELSQAGYRRVLAAAMAEALGLLRAAGIRPAGAAGAPPALVPAILRLPDPLFQRVARRMLAIDPQARSSMWEDIQRGRTTEIDYINGEVALLAEALERPAPVNRRLIELIKALEAGDQRLANLSAAELAWRTGLLD